MRAQVQLEQTPDIVSSIAERFARALADDFSGAARLLEEDCVYEASGEKIRRVERVMQSFMRASE
ncbi:MAG: hypothetical protein M3Z14_07855, partial [Candidatus Eremiobacteraeota bacterium]|nr:hypothetical protein [Candidatus Eremiobacteraeota bacterium]